MAAYYKTRWQEQRTHHNESKLVIATSESQNLKPDRQIALEGCDQLVRWRDDIIAILSKNIKPLSTLSHSTVLTLSLSTLSLSTVPGTAPSLSSARYDLKEDGGDEGGGHLTRLRWDFTHLLGTPWVCLSVFELVPRL